MLEFSHPQSLQSAEGNFDCTSPAHWNTAKRCLSVKFLLSCIIDQISQNQPCITARQESKPKGSCPPKEQRHVFTEIQGPPTLEQKLCKSISRGHKMLRDTSSEGTLVQMILQSIRSSRCSHKGWAEFQESLREPFSIQFNSCSAEVSITGLFQGDSVYQDPHGLWTSFTLEN